MELNHTSVGSGTPVLLIHGLGSSIADWYLQMDDFSADHEVICCDLRGHGDSAKAAGPYSMEMLTEDVSELISALGRGPMHVVGISLGGMLGLQLALDHPEQVRSLTVVNSAPEVTIRTIRATARPVVAYGDLEDSRDEAYGRLHRRQSVSQR